MVVPTPCRYIYTDTTRTEPINHLLRHFNHYRGTPDLLSRCYYCYYYYYWFHNVTNEEFPNGYRTIIEHNRDGYNNKTAKLLHGRSILCRCIRNVTGNRNGRNIVCENGRQRLLYYDKPIHWGLMSINVIFMISNYFFFLVEPADHQCLRGLYT